MEIETCKMKEDFILLTHNEKISHVHSFYDGREVFYFEGIGNSFFIVWSKKTGFQICETEESILHQFYSNGNSIRIPDMTKTQFFYQQMKDSSQTWLEIVQIVFDSKSSKKKNICKIGHIHTNFSKEDDSNHIQSSEYMLMIQDTFAILSYYKDYGYSISTKTK
jgi:hypothetical protein